MEENKTEVLQEEKEAALQEKENEIELLNEMGEKVESNIVRVENTSFIYFFLPDFSGEYCLSINGEKIFISG